MAKILFLPVVLATATPIDAEVVLQSYAPIFPVDSVILTLASDANREQPELVIAALVGIAAPAAAAAPLMASSEDAKRIFFIMIPLFRACWRP